MLDQFYNLQSIALGILKIFFLMGIGFALSAKGILKEQGSQGLSKVLYWASLPALIIAKTTSSFNPLEFAYWWVLPLAAIIMSAVSVAIGVSACRFFKSFNARREFVVSCGWQNSAFLPIALTAFICTGQFCDNILVSIFLFLIGFNLSMFAFVPGYLAKGKKPIMDSSVMFNPSLVATVLSIIYVFAARGSPINPMLLDPLKMLGDTTFPMALVLLGAQLNEHKGYRLINFKELALLHVVKLFLVPLVTLLIVMSLHIPVFYRFFLLLEAAMPVAITLIVIGEEEKANNGFLSAGIFYTHILSILTVPAWLYVFHFLNK